MIESLACETVDKSKVSTLDILGLLDCLFGSPEQSALSRAKATLLRDSGKRTRGDEKSAETQAQDKNCKSGEHVDDETVTVIAHGVRRQDSLCDAERIKFQRQKNNHNHVRSPRVVQLLARPQRRVSKT